MAAYQYIYVMKGLGKTYPSGREVLKDVWLSFLPGAKIGVLGTNGAGKSTLLRIMAGEERDFAGEAWAAEGARVGYLSQEPALDDTKDVFGNIIEGLAETKALLDRFEAVSARFAAARSSLARARRDFLTCRTGRASINFRLLYQLIKAADVRSTRRLRRAQNESEFACPLRARRL